MQTKPELNIEQEPVAQHLSCSLVKDTGYIWSCSERHEAHGIIYEKSPRSLPYISSFQLFSSHGTHKLITKILQHTKKYIFHRSDKKIGIILIHSLQMVIVELACCHCFI